VGALSTHATFANRLMYTGIQVLVCAERAHSHTLSCTHAHTQFYTLAADSKGGASGGTIASGMNMLEVEGQEMSKVGRDQYYLASYHYKWVCVYVGVFVCVGLCVWVLGWARACCSCYGCALCVRSLCNRIKQLEVDKAVSS
jgi:hypothetical protein